MRGPCADPVPWQAFMQTMTPRNRDLETPNFLFQQVDKGPCKFPFLANHLLE